VTFITGYRAGGRVPLSSSTIARAQREITRESTRESSSVVFDHRGFNNGRGLSREVTTIDSFSSRSRRYAAECADAPVKALPSAERRWSLVTWIALVHFREGRRSCPRMPHIATLPSAPRDRRRDRNALWNLNFGLNSDRAIRHSPHSESPRWIVQLSDSALNVRIVCTHPKIIEGGVGHSHPGDVLAELLEYRRVLLHAYDGPRHQLSMRPHRHVPRLYPHEVVEGELQY